jgi:hypothetical protein
MQPTISLSGNVLQLQWRLGESWKRCAAGTGRKSTPLEIHPNRWTSGSAIRQAERRGAIGAETSRQK